MPPLLGATALFVLTYAVIVSERIDRTKVALAGGFLMVAFGWMSEEEAIKAIDWNTLGLLVGMMVLVNVLRQTGIFRYSGLHLARMVRGEPWPLLATFAVFTAVASAFLDNVTTVLLMVPVTIAIAETLEFDPRPFIITQVLASNIGGTATLIGDPPNILIGSATGLDFVQFLINLGPVVALILLLTVAWLWSIYGRALTPHPGRLKLLERVDERTAISNWPLLRRSLIVLAATLLGFMFHGLLHLEAATIAMFGATALLLWGRVDPHRVLAEVEWSTIFFFVGLFILVGGVEKVGLLDLAARRVAETTGGNLALTALVLLWFSALASAVVDNIPAVATLIPVVFALGRVLFPGLPDEQLALLPGMVPLWWALALGACLGGNGSLVGASANVVASGVAARHHAPISFWQFTRLGAGVTLLSLVVSTLYLWLRYLR